MDFNFSFKNISGVAKSHRLQPWGIYDVKFVDARVDEVQGKKDPTATYKILKVRFEDKDQNYYEESIFFPKEGDDFRREYENANGGTTVFPSVQDNRMLLIANIAEILNPEGYKKMQEVSDKFKSFDDICKLFVKVLEKVKGKTTKIKLTGINRNGRIEPSSPRVAGISKEGELFHADSFIGPNVAFTAYEMKRRDQIQNAAPAPVESFKTVAESSSDDDFDYDSLLS